MTDTQTDTQAAPAALPDRPTVRPSGLVLRLAAGLLPAPVRAWLATPPGQLTLALITAAVGFFAHRYGFDPRAVPSPAPLMADALATPLDYEGVRYEGHDGAEHQESPGRRWPTDVIPYSVDYASAAAIRPAVDPAAIKAAVRQAAQAWCEGLSIDMPEVAPDRALIRISFGPIDGPLGTLGLTYLSDGTLSPKTMLLDASERWTAGGPAPGQVSITGVVAHELGHGLGLAHAPPGSPALMGPYYTSQVQRPQPADFAAAAALNYGRRPTPPPADVLTVPVQIRTADVIEGLKRLGYEVKR